MRGPRGRMILAPLALLLVLMGAGCSEDSRSADAVGSPAELPAVAACTQAVEAVVRATQRYVDGYATAGTVRAPDAGDSGEVAPAPSQSAPPFTEVEFQTALGQAQTELAELDCLATQVRTDLAIGLGFVEAEGPVAQAVFRHLSASLTGRLAPQATTRTASPGDDLADLLAELPPGSTLELQPGEFVLAEPLVILSSVVLRGAGSADTTIVSTAPEAAILVLADGRVDVADLTVARTGAAPGSVLLAGPAASVVVSSARLTGAVATEDGQGGAGILMFAGEDPLSDRGTTLEVTDSELAGNEAAGAVLTGAHRASVVGSTIRDNGECGICFLGGSTGSVEASSFSANRVGVVVAGTASPVLVGGIVADGDVGLQVFDAAQPLVSGMTISGSSQAAVVYTGTAAGAMDGVVCRDVPFGIVVGPAVTPTLGENDCGLVASEQ